jgi:alpha-1,3-fucosyltransferase
MSNYDAVVIHGVDFYLDDRANKYIRSWRRPHQRLVFFMLEPPTIGPSFSSSIYNHFWNYTMTYRRDSDILRPYGYFVPKQDQSYGGIPRLVAQPQATWPIDYNEADFVLNILPKKGPDFRGRAKKPRKIAWVVSNCQTKSRRESFVTELQKYVDIDVFGRCGTAACDFQGAQVHTGNCSTTITRDYKFYLSLENNFARDYVTEKFFARISTSLVPIVLGQADYKIIAPPHSFINALDYENPKALADFLDKLDRNDTEYLSYFWWQHYYHAEHLHLQRLAFCDLCAKLHEDLEPKSYPNFEQWWHIDGWVDQKLPQLLAMIGHEVPESRSNTRETPRLRISFEK